MHSSPAKSDTGSPERGSFALVTYLPDPLGKFLTELRRSLPNAEYPQPAAHITFLPPRVLTIPVATAEAQIRRILNSFEPFELELGKVLIFAETNILYLDIQDGILELLRLHDSLNRGDLHSAENFEYIPHLTLGGPLLPVEAAYTLQQAEHAWSNSGLSRRFEVREAVLLWQSGGCLDRHWAPISSYELSPLAARRTSALANRTS